jgi:hypothetical protein
MARPQDADGGNALQVWRVAANILNKQSRTADKGWSSSLGIGRGANNSSPQKISSLRQFSRKIKMDLSEIGLGLDWIDLAQDRDQWRALMNRVMHFRVP